MEISPLNDINAKSIVKTIKPPLGQKGKRDSMANEWGQAIDLSDIAKSRRGATATYEDGLIKALTDAFGKGQALAVTPMAVLEESYKTSDEYANAKQANAAEIRKHFSRLVELELVPAGSKVSINWHPETGIPQVSLKA
jgi:hypothetical protein